MAAICYWLDSFPTWTRSKKSIVTQSMWRGGGFWFLTPRPILKNSHENGGWKPWGVWSSKLYEISPKKLISIYLGSQMMGKKCFAWKTDRLVFGGLSNKPQNGGLLQVPGIIYIPCKWWACFNGFHWDGVTFHPEMGCCGVISPWNNLFFLGPSCGVISHHDHSKTVRFGCCHGSHPWNLICFTWKNEEETPSEGISGVEIPRIDCRMFPLNPCRVSGGGSKE